MLQHTHIQLLRRGSRQTSTENLINIDRSTTTLATSTYTPSNDLCPDYFSIASPKS